MVADPATVPPVSVGAGSPLPRGFEVALVVIGLTIGGPVGAVMAVVALVILRNEGPGATATAAAVLLGAAAVATAAVDFSALTGSYAMDREVAGLAGQWAAVCGVVAVAALARAERPAVPAPVVSMGRSSSRWTVMPAVPAVVIGTLAVLVRVAVAPVALRPDLLEITANLRAGLGYTRGGFGSLTATALHPPLAPVLAAIWPGPLRTALLVVSALTAVAVTRLARRVGGGRAALAAGLLAVGLPSLWGQQLPEALAALAVTTGLLLAWPADLTPGRAAGAGAALGLAALARPEALVVLPLALVWIRLVREGVGSRLLVVVAAAGLVVLLPWELRMQRTFDTWLPSTALGATLEGANQPAARAGVRAGELVPLPAPTLGEREGLIDRNRREAGWEALRQASPGLLATRVLRAWDLWPPDEIRAAREARQLGLPGGTVGVLLEGAVAMLAATWLFTRRRHWRRLFPLFALPFVFSVMSALTYGSRDLRSWVAPVVAVIVGTLVTRAGPAARPTTS